MDNYSIIFLLDAVDSVWLSVRDSPHYCYSDLSVPGSMDSLRQLLLDTTIIRLYLFVDAQQKLHIV